MFFSKEIVYFWYIYSMEYYFIAVQYFKIFKVFFKKMRTVV